MTNTHSHDPQDLGDGKYGLHVQDPDEPAGAGALPEDGDHYYMEIGITDGGLVVDVYDEHGEMLLESWHRTYEELLDLAWGRQRTSRVTCPTCRTRIEPDGTASQPA